jgi:cell division protein FtsI (penicillin-binding protein 3)
VLGMSARDAVYLIESNGMSVNIIGYGKVINQSIPAGSPAFNGGLIELTLK